jgi:hypothetical protein
MFKLGDIVQLNNHTNHGSKGKITRIIHIMEMNYDKYEYRVQLFDFPISVIARADQLLHTTKDTDGDR